MFEYTVSVARLVAAVLAVEGVVGIDERPGFDIDDRYPAVPGHILTADVVERDRTGCTTNRSAE